jgi:hypothetical protein
LRALRLETRRELFAALNRTQTIHQSVERYIQFALDHSYAYEVLFDGVGKPPSLHEPWPSFNLMRDRISQRVGGTPRQHSRLMLSIWSLMHGTAMLIIRGRFEGVLRAQTIHACIDACDSVLDAAQRKRFGNSGPKWPANLILGEGKNSQVGNNRGNRKSPSNRK